MRYPAGAPVNLSSAGFLTLGGAWPDRDLPTLGSAAPPDAVVLPLGVGNLTFAVGGALCAATVGAAPDRRWVVEWRGLTPMGSTVANRASFEVVFGEREGTIDFLYRDISLGGLRAVSYPAGLESDDGARAVRSCDAPGCAHPQSDATPVRFTPR